MIVIKILAVVRNEIFANATLGDIGKIRDCLGLLKLQGVPNYEVARSPSKANTSCILSKIS